jgi:diaminopimelate decarboxylase
LGKSLYVLVLFIYVFIYLFIYFLKVMDYAATQGVNMTLLDIGGGFPGDDGGTLSFGEIAEVITPLLDELFPKSSGIRIIGEPGNFRKKRTKEN